MAAKTIRAAQGLTADDVRRETVASVGVIMGRSLPFTTSNTTIKTFRHALSLDEVCTASEHQLDSASHC